MFAPRSLYFVGITLSIALRAKALQFTIALRVTLYIAFLIGQCLRGRSQSVAARSFAANSLSAFTMGFSVALALFAPPSQILLTRLVAPLSTHVSIIPHQLTVR